MDVPTLQSRDVFGAICEHVQSIENGHTLSALITSRRVFTRTCDSQCTHFSVILLNFLSSSFYDCAYIHVCVECCWQEERMVEQHFADSENTLVRGTVVAW